MAFSDKKESMSLYSISLEHPNYSACIQYLFKTKLNSRDGHLKVGSQWVDSVFMKKENISSKTWEIDQNNLPSNWHFSHIDAFYVSDLLIKKVHGNKRRESWGSDYQFLICQVQFCAVIFGLQYTQHCTDVWVPLYPHHLW